MAMVSGIVRFARAGDSVTDWAYYYPSIARVRVVDAGPFLFNSDSGLAPTPDATGGWPGSVYQQLLLERAVALDILELISGDQLIGLEGVVTLEAGSPTGGIPVSDYGPLGFNNVGTEGIVFLTSEIRYHVRESDPEDMRPRLADARSLLLTLGNEYEVVDALNFYRFEGSNATSDLDGRTMTIAELEVEIEDGLGP